MHTFCSRLAIPTRLRSLEAVGRFGRASVPLYVSLKRQLTPPNSVSSISHNFRRALMAAAQPLNRQHLQVARISNGMRRTVFV